MLRKQELKPITQPPVPNYEHRGGQTREEYIQSAIANTHMTPGVNPIGGGTWEEYFGKMWDSPNVPMQLMGGSQLGNMPRKQEPILNEQIPGNGFDAPGTWGASPPPNIDKLYTAVMPREGYTYEYNQITGARREVPKNTLPIQAPTQPIQTQTQPSGFQRISPSLGVANISPVQPQVQPQQGYSSIQSKIRSLYAPLPAPQQMPIRRIFRILPIRRRTNFAV